MSHPVPDPGLAKLSDNCGCGYTVQYLTGNTNPESDLFLASEQSIMKLPKWKILIVKITSIFLILLLSSFIDAELHAFSLCKGMLWFLNFPKMGILRRNSESGICNERILSDECLMHLNNAFVSSGKTKFGIKQIQFGSIYK